MYRTDFQAARASCTVHDTLYEAKRDITLNESAPFREIIVNVRYLSFGITSSTLQELNKNIKQNLKI